MKSKLFVIILACVLVVSVVGVSFAMYVKGAEKNVSIGYDSEAVTLTFGSTELAAKTLDPDHLSATYEITLAKTGVTPEDGMKGFFKVDLIDLDEGDLSTVLVASAAVTYNEVITNLNNDTLRGSGYTCYLSELPQSVVLTIAINTEKEGYDYADYAEESVKIKLYWVPYTNDAYYLRSADTDWCPDPTMIMAGPDDEGQYVIEGVHFNAGQEFKVTHNGDWFANVKGGEGNKAIYNPTSTNMYVEVAGTYNLYYHPTNGMWINLVAAD